MSSALPLFWQSLLIGLSIAAPVGQIGVLAIQRTLERGRAAGLATGLGAAAADAVYGAIGAFGVSALIGWLLGARVWLTVFGAAFLLWMAWGIARKPVKAPTDAGPSEAETVPAGAQQLLRDFAGTFLLTLSNPSTILSFIAVFGVLAGRAPVAAPWVMVAGVLVGSALWWLLLSTGVGLLRHRFDARWQRAVNRVSAAMLAGLALWQVLRLAMG